MFQTNMVRNFGKVFMKVKIKHSELEMIVHYCKSYIARSMEVQILCPRLTYYGGESERLGSKSAKLIVVGSNPTSLTFSKI